MLLADAMPEALKRKFFYKAGNILCLFLCLDFEPPKDKFLVLLDDQDPPLFFLINSRSRGIAQAHELELRHEDYEFLSNDVSFLNYDQTFESFDFVSSLPSKEEIVQALLRDPTRFKGTLRKKDAEDLLYGVEYEAVAIEGRDKARIVSGLKGFIESIAD